MVLGPTYSVSGEAIGKGPATYSCGKFSSLVLTLVELLVVPIARERTPVRTVFSLMLGALAYATLLAWARCWAIVAVTSTMSGNGQYYHKSDSVVALPIGTTQSAADFGTVDLLPLLRAAPRGMT